MKKVVTLLLLWLSVFPVFAEEYKTVTCYEAGGLDKILSEEELKTITHLKLVGNINHLDLYYVGQANVVQALDIEETRVNMISGCFCRNSSLKEIRLPETCYSIVNSFKESAIQKINLDGVTSEIYSSFVSCPQLKEIGKIAAKTTYDSFNNCAIDTLTISDSVTEIGAVSFMNCPSLCYIQFPNRLTKIGEKSFSGCTSLDEISMMSNVVPTLGTEGNWMSCFDNATRVACRLYVPIGCREKYSEAWRFERVVEIDNLSSGDTLRWDIEYTDLHVETPGTLSSKLTSESLIQAKGFRITGTLNKDDLTVLNNLSNTAFLRVLDLRECRMEGDSIPASAFYGSQISEIYLPESITKIGSRAFAASVLKWLDIPADNHIDYIGDRAFSSCSQLCSVLSFPQVTAIGNEVFNYCLALTEVSLPKVTRVGAGSFYNCWRLKKVKLGNIEPVDNQLVISAAIESVGEGAFGGCKQLKSVDMSASSLQSLPRKLFFDCAYLEQVSLPQSLTQMGDSVFACTRLASINVPSGVTQIPEGCFAGCSNLLQVRLSPQTVSVGDYAFTSCSFASLSLPAAVQNLGEGCIRNCAELTDFQFPEEMTEVSRAFFDGCLSLRHVTLSPVTTRLSAGAFRGVGIESIELPERLESIGDSCFLDCSRLTAIVLPETVSEIGKAAFGGSALSSIVIPASIDTIRSSTFSGCTHLSQVSLPKGLKRIDDSAFVSCSSLQYITLSDSVELGDYVFAGAGLKLFTVPSVNENVPRGLLSGCDNLEVVYLLSSVKKVGYSFLEDCVNLKKVYLQAPVPPETEVYEDYRYGRFGYELYATYAPFTNVPKSCMLYVPQENYYDYWNNGGLWKESFTMEGMDFSGIEQAENGFRIITEDGNGLTICLDRAMPVVVYDLQGRLVAQMSGVAGDNRLPLDRGVYIVCCGTNRVKVLCR